MNGSASVRIVVLAASVCVFASLICTVGGHEDAFQVMNKDINETSLSLFDLFLMENSFYDFLGTLCRVCFLNSDTMSVSSNNLDSINSSNKFCQCSVLSKEDSTQEMHVCNISDMHVDPNVDQQKESIKTKYFCPKWTVFTILSMFLCFCTGFIPLTFILKLLFDYYFYFAGTTFFVFFIVLLVDYYLVKSISISSTLFDVFQGHTADSDSVPIECSQSYDPSLNLEADSEHQPENEEMFPAPIVDRTEEPKASMIISENLPPSVQPSQSPPPERNLGSNTEKPPLCKVPGPQTPTFAALPKSSTGTVKKVNPVGDIRQLKLKSHTSIRGRQEAVVSIRHRLDPEWDSLSFSTIVEEEIEVFPLEVVTQEGGSITTFDRPTIKGDCDL